MGDVYLNHVNQIALKTTLVGGWTTHLKNMLVKLDHFPWFRGENNAAPKTIGRAQPSIAIIIRSLGFLPLGSLAGLTSRDKNWMKNLGISLPTFSKWCNSHFLRRRLLETRVIYPIMKKSKPKKGCFFPWRTRIFFNKGVELWKWLRMTPHLAHRSQEKWWYPWDGTLNNQPHIHLIWWVFIGSQSPFKGLQHGGLNSFRGPYPKGFPSIFSTSWWFQPIWRILVKMGIFPK